MNSPEIEAAARDYLRQELAERAPQMLRWEADYREAPLSGEGAVTVFSFDLPPGPGLAGCADGYEPRHYVVVGETAPNFFPAFGLGPDDAYSLHLGTRFMVELRIARVEDSLEPPAARDELRHFVLGCNPQAELRSLELAGLFRCEDQLFAVYRVRIDEVEVYVLGADCPPGFYELTPHPPQVALRLHLGKLIRAEAEEAAAQAWRTTRH